MTQADIGMCHHTVRQYIRDHGLTYTVWRCLNCKEYLKSTYLNRVVYRSEQVRENERMWKYD